MVIQIGSFFFFYSVPPTPRQDVIYKKIKTSVQKPQPQESKGKYICHIYEQLKDIFPYL